MSGIFLFLKPITNSNKNEKIHSFLIRINRYDVLLPKIHSVPTHQKG